MGRFFNWDYKKPYYYMVTIKRLRDFRALSILDASAPWGIKRDYALTRVIIDTLNKFLEATPSVASISPYAIMPDHLHLLIKIADIPNRKSLPDIVDLLKRLLRNALQKATGSESAVFEKDWHDLIVKKSQQLDRFFAYISNNPKMAMLRRENHDKFHCYRAYRHWRAGKEPFDLVGNPELLDEPAFLSVRLSRSILPDSPEWQKAAAFYAAWRPGGTAAGTWWSAAEKMACRQILANGGNVIVLSPRGFGPRWHPAGEEAQNLCAQGRLLYLSPYPPNSAKLPAGETRARCLALNELARQMAQARPPAK